MPLDELTSSGESRAFYWHLVLPNLSLTLLPPRSLSLSPTGPGLGEARRGSACPETESPAFPRATWQREPACPLAGASNVPASVSSLLKMDTPLNFRESWASPDLLSQNMHFNSVDIPSCPRGLGLQFYFCEYAWNCPVTPLYMKGSPDKRCLCAVNACCGPGTGEGFSSLTPVPPPAVLSRLLQCSESMISP